jgi:hypothetical protein
MLTTMPSAPPGTPNAPYRDVVNHRLPLSDPTQFFLNFHEGFKQAQSWYQDLTQVTAE